MVLGSLFTTRIYELSSLFLGLSLFSLPLILKEEKQALSQKNRLPFFLLGLFVVFVITWFNPAGGKGVQVDVAQLTPTLGLYIFVCAMIAICAMVLPGISGSTMLLIFGLYVPIIGAIREFLHMNLSYLPVLIIFGCGVLTGIVGIIRIVKTHWKCIEPPWFTLSWDSWSVPSTPSLRAPPPLRFPSQP